MKKFILILAGLITFGMSNAQTISFNPRTGDVDMDGFLKDISTSAKNDLNAFVNDATKTFNVAKEKVEGLIKLMDPGDVYMTLQTSQIINKPVEEVKDAYLKNKDKGWGEIAKELGIKPGSKEFHAMKDQMQDKKGKGENGNGHGNNGGNGHGHGKNK
jgi:hypothetical protein